MMEEFGPILDFINNFVVPVLLLIWQDVRKMAKEVHRLDRRMVRVETTLQLKPLTED